MKNHGLGGMGGVGVGILDHSFIKIDFVFVFPFMVFPKGPILTGP